MSLTVGEIIYKSFVPTLKMALCIGAGWLSAKRGAITPASSKGISLIAMNIGLPCLIFSSMVSAFTPESVQAFGPLVMMAVMYQAVGLLLAWLIRELVPVPRDFRWGILVMGIISNWGNLPTAVVQTVANRAPFNPTTDEDLGVAYIAIFILVMNSTFFALGVHKICAWDFMEDRVVDDPLPFKQRWRERLHKVKRLSVSKNVLESGPTEPASSNCPSVAIDIDVSPAAFACQPLGQRVSRRESHGSNTSRLELATGEKLVILPQQVVHQDEASIHIVLPQQTTSPWKRFWRIVANIPPPTWAVGVGLIFSLVPPLKALLYSTPSWTGTRMPNAPDGNPPLNFVLETAEFLGALTVPLALIVLGASFARLKLPANWRDLPLTAIVAMTVAKMVVVPIFSIFVVLALQQHTALFPPEQKIRTFVTILLSGTPAAANQLIVTQLYNPEGTAHTLASFLLLQYALMFVLSTALAAIAMYIVK